MKHTLIKTLGLAVLGIVFLPLLAHAATITQTAVTADALGVTVKYEMNGAPAQTTKIYASVADVETGTWIKRDLYIAQVTPTDPTPFVFDITFKISELNLVAGKTYVYYLADAPAEPLMYLTNPKCFNTGGPVLCGNVTPPPAAPTTTTSSGTVFGPQPNPGSSSPTVPTPLLGGGSATSSGTYQAPPMTFGGISVVFPREQQVITETSAEIHGIASALIIIPVELSFVSGVSGSPLGNQQQLFSKVMYPGETMPVVMNFTGLTPGTAYYFVLRNSKTNTASRAIYFTTPGGATNERAMFAGQRIGGNDAPPEVAFTDTVSDTGIVPKCGRTANADVPLGETRMCGYQDILQLAANVINFIFILIVPVVAGITMYTGAMLIIYGKKSDPTGAVMDKLKGYRTRLFNIGGGVIIILFAWTFIAMILRELGVKPNYILLDLFN